MGVSDPAPRYLILDAEDVDSDHAILHRQRADALGSDNEHRWGGCTFRTDVGNGSSLGLERQLVMRVILSVREGATPDLARFVPPESARH